MLPGYFDEDEMYGDEQERLRRWVERELFRFKARSYGLTMRALAAQEGAEDEEE